VHAHPTQGRLEEAERMFRRALVARQAALGSRCTREVAECLHNMALLAKQQQRFEDAERMYREAIDIRMAVLGEDHLDVALSLHNLGVLEKKTHPANAATTLQRALGIREKALGADHPEVATSCTSLGLLHSQLGDHAAAEPLLRRALHIVDNWAGGTHKGTAAGVGGRCVPET
jgi:tetratricopeptide (TPR) repeat protein